MATVELETFCFDDTFAQWLHDHGICYARVEDAWQVIKYVGSEEALRKMIAEHFVGEPDDHENSTFAREFYSCIKT